MEVIQNENILQEQDPDITTFEEFQKVLSELEKPNQNQPVSELSLEDTKEYQIKPPTAKTLTLEISQKSALRILLSIIFLAVLFLILPFIMNLNFAPGKTLKDLGLETKPQDPHRTEYLKIEETIVEEAKKTLLNSEHEGVFKEELNRDSEKGSKKNKNEENRKEQDEEA